MRRTKHKYNIYNNKYVHFNMHINIKSEIDCMEPEREKENTFTRKHSESALKNY